MHIDLSCISARARLSLLLSAAYMALLFGKGMYAVIYAGMAGMIAAGHTAVCCVDYCSASKGRNIPLKKIDIPLEWHQLIDIRYALIKQFPL